MNAESLPAPDRWKRASDLFLDWVDLPAVELQARLKSLRTEDPELAGLVAGLLDEDPGPEAAPVVRHFGPYVEIARVGRGGMGEVFLAERADGAFDRKVAIKVLHLHAQTPELEQRFERERRTLAALEHESIVRLIDGGTTEQGVPYIVMEYVEGQTLGVYLQEHRVAVKDALALFLQVVLGVAYAHQRGVTHRDLKPSNILVRFDGSPRIVDFGIAKIEGELAEGDDHVLTRTGERLFTPDYASPEQVSGEPVSPASDVFALGVILYEMVSGVSPWPIKSSQRKVEAAVLEASPVPPSRRLSGTAARPLRGDIDTIVLKCLEADPERRYGNAAELARDLEQHLTGRAIDARRLNPAQRGVRLVRRRPWHTAALGATLVAAAALGLLGLAQRAQDARRGELEAAIPTRLEAAKQLSDRGLGDEAWGAVESVLLDAEAAGVSAGLIADVRVKRAALAGMTAQSFDVIGLIEEARATLPEGHPRHVHWLVELAKTETNVLAGRGDVGGARRVASELVELARTEWPAKDPELASALLLFARLQVFTGDFAAALPTLDEVAEHLPSPAPDHDRIQAEADGLRGRSLVELKRVNEAIPLLTSSSRTLRWHHGMGHKDVAEQMTFLGRALMLSGKAEEGVAALELACEGYAELDQPQAWAYALDALAMAAANAGRHEYAIGKMRENQALIAAKLPKMRPRRFMTEYQIGFVKRQLGDLEGARKCFELALQNEAAELKPLGPGPEAQVRHEFSALLLAMGEEELARSELEQTLKLWVSLHGESHAFTQQLRGRLRSWGKSPK
ncbi:MAG: serine/threonine-protein kinase [Planctomycetota bacterium]|jgi:serine/threonine-protein kinase